MTSYGCKAMVVLSLLGGIIGGVVTFSLGCSAPLIASGFLAGGALGSLTGVAIIAAEQVITEREVDQFGDQLLVNEYNTIDDRGPDTATTGDTFGVLKEVRSDLEACD